MDNQKLNADFANKTSSVNLNDPINSSNYLHNTISNQFYGFNQSKLNSYTNSFANPTLNPISNSTLNPISNSISNSTLNSISNSTLNPISSSTLNPISNSISSSISNSITDSVSNSLTNPFISQSSFTTSDRMIDGNRFANSFLINPISNQYSTSPFINLSSVISTNPNNSKHDQANVPLLNSINQSTGLSIDRTCKIAKKRGRKPKNENPKKKANLTNDNQTKKKRTSTAHTVQQSVNGQIDCQSSLVNESMNNPTYNLTNNRLSHVKQITNQQPINYSDLATQEIDYFSDTEFDYYYSSSNLYDNSDYFDNRMFKIFVVRYGNELRVFKPVCVVKENSSLLCRILGTYCLDTSKIVDSNELPVDFIWPLNSGKHSENVQTIRRLIQQNPVDDQLPYTNATDSVVTVRPFRLDEYLRYDKVSNRIDKLNKRMNLVENNSENKEPNNNDKKFINEFYQQSTDQQNADQQSIDQQSTDLQSTDLQSIDQQSTSDTSSGNIEKHQIVKPKPHHCPYCFKKFSASFNVKMHFSGRFKNNGQSQIVMHISCPVAKKIANRTLKPISCSEINCELCLKMNN